MKRFLRKHLTTVIVPSIVLVIALTWRQQDPGGLIQRVQQQVFDQYQRMQPREYKEPEVGVRIIDIDDESLAKLGKQWPWPRTLMAQMVANLANAGAVAIVFDVVFAEPDRTSPKSMLDLWAETADIGAVRPTIEQLPDHDAVFADIIAQAGNVVTGFVLTDRPDNVVPVVRAGPVSQGVRPERFLTVFSGAVNNLPAIEAAAAGNGTFSFNPDADLTLRKVPLLVRLRDEPKFYPSLSAEALRMIQDAGSFQIKGSDASGEFNFGQNVGITSIKIGQVVVPTDAGGHILLHFTEYRPDRYIPAWKVMSADFDPALVEGKILFVGTSASGLKDIRPTPLTPAMPGVEGHVQALEQMLLGHYLKRPDFADGIEWVFVFAVGIILIGLLANAGAAASAAFGVVAIAGFFAISWFAYTQWLWLFDPVTPSIGAFAVYLSGSLLGYLRSEGEKRRVRGQFSQYMSPELVDQLAREPDRLKLGGETRMMTILFCDLRGFTTISEQFKTDPQGLTQLINKFLTPMTAIIRSQKGTIDKYIGDCIMSFWNAPLDDPDHADNACRSVLLMHEGMVRLNEELEAEAKAAGRRHVPLAIGIGLNSGEVVAGNMGSDQRFDYTVLGDAVNLSSRLEGQSKTYGVGTVIGEVTRQMAPSFAHLELDLIAVKGKKEAVRIYTVFGGPEVAGTEAFQRLAEEHDRMIAAYRAQQWAEARALLGRLRAMEPKLNGLYDLYEERIMYFEENPPGAEWDGVFVATSK